MFKGFANPGDSGGHELWVKCTTSVECKTDILAVLTVISGLDPHMIIEHQWFTYDIVVITLYLLGLIV